MGWRIARHWCFVCTAVLAVAQTDSRPFEFSAPDQKLLAEADKLDAQFESKDLVYHDSTAEAYLTSIGNRLTDDAPVPDRVVYKFRILRDPMVNAFALPNGSIYINTGLVAAMKNEAELAAVMAHEITHVSNRHAYLENRGLRKKAVAIDVIMLAAGATGYARLGVVFGASIAVAANVSQIAIIASVYGYSREMENEADTAGYARLMRSDYEGAEMAQALELLDERLEFEPVEPFWRTHPKLVSRIATARKLAETGTRPSRRAIPESDYLDHLAPVIRYNIGLDLENRRAVTAVNRAQRLVNGQPGNTGDLVLLADGYRALGAKNALPDASKPTNEAKNTVRKQMLKMTAQEEQRALLAAPSGKETLAANQAKAESLYREAIAADPKMAETHRGLGMLYQDEGKHDAAAGEYRAYLDLAPADALDRLRIERRLQAMSAGGQ